MTIGEMFANLAKEVERREEAVRHRFLIEVRQIILKVRRGDFAGALTSLELVREALVND